MGKGEKAGSVEFSKWRGSMMLVLMMCVGVILLSASRSLHHHKYLGSAVILSPSGLATTITYDEHEGDGAGDDTTKNNVENVTFAGDYQFKAYLTDAQLLQEGYDAVAARGAPRIAFLFIVRGEIPHEPLWKRFLEGYKGQYSLYVHAAPGFTFPENSIFRGNEVPSKPCPRFSRGIVDALRRLMAYALLDPRYNNRWFVNACEATIPLRAFPFVFDYLATSPVSFVESFLPNERYQSWRTEPEFNSTELRKGELWMALERRHARVVVGDTRIYFKFTEGCKVWCTWDEQYVQTLLSIRDGEGIAKRTVVYVNWKAPHAGSPFTYGRNDVSSDTIKDLQSRTWDSDGERHDTALDNTTYSCVHNGVPDSPCFLFARKFRPETTQIFLDLPPQELGY